MMEINYVVIGLLLWSAIPWALLFVLNERYQRAIEEAKDSMSSILLKIQFPDKEPVIMLFTAGKMARLNAAYHSAVKAGDTEFEFDGHVFLPEHAKYLLEFLIVTFGRKGEQK